MNIYRKLKNNTDINMNKKIRLVELLTERKQVGTVYHFTSSKRLFDILDSDYLKATRSTYNFADNLISKDFYLTVSTTRDKNFVKTRTSTGVPVNIGGSDFGIVLDGDRLSDTYQTMAYDETYAPDYSSVEIEDLKSLFGDEMEQLWYGKKIQADQGIKNLKRYITKIVITKDFMKKIVNYNYDSSFFPKQFKTQYMNSWDYQTSPVEKINQIKSYIENQYNIPVEVQK